MRYSKQASMGINGSHAKIECSYSCDLASPLRLSSGYSNKGVSDRPKKKNPATKPHAIIVLVSNHTERLMLLSRQMRSKTPKMQMLDFLILS